MKTSKSNISKIVIVVSLVSILAISGCVTQGSSFFDSLFGKVGDIFGLDVVKPSRQVSAIGVTDPLVIDRVWTLPENRVLPDTTLQVFMEVSNKDNDPSKQGYPKVNIFDAGVFKDRNGNKFCNSYTLPKSIDECGPNPITCGSGAARDNEKKCELKIGATKQIDFVLKGPTKEEIANVITKAKINYKVSYSYKGGTNYEILVVSYNEILRRQKDGKALTTNLIDTKGSGPIKIDVELGTPYVISGEPSTTTKAYIIFKLRNAGSGSLVGSAIEKEGGLKIFIPTELGAKIESPDFECSVEGADNVCKNKEEIKFFKSESEPFQIIVSDIIKLPEGTPFRTHLIKAEVFYDYELRGSAEVEINPIIKR